MTAASFEHISNNYTEVTRTHLRLKKIKLDKKKKWRQN